MEVKKPNKSLLFYAFVVMIILILLNALVIPKISERSVTETTYDESVSYTHLDVYKRQIQSLDTIWTGTNDAATGIDALVDELSSNLE